MSDFEKNEAPVSAPQTEEVLSAAVEQSASAEGEAASEPQKNKRDRLLRSVGAVLFALIFLFAGILAGWFLGAASVDERARNLAWLVERVADNYYKEIDDETLYDTLYSALELDRFCYYYNEEEYDKRVSESKGSNEGYGLSLAYEGNDVRVLRTVYNSPAELAGLETGMRIYRYGADESSLTEATKDNFYDYLVSHDGATVEIGYEGGEKKIVTLSPAAYSAAYCEYRDSEGNFRFRGEGTPALTQTGEGMPLLGDAAYIRLSEFDGNASKEFKACLDLMKERGRKDLVLDLRMNGGGYLKTLCEIAAHLLRNAEGKSPLVASSRYRNGRTDEYDADGNDFNSYFSADSRIRVLADENTASASEALMGAMLDYGTIGYDDIYLRVNESDGLARTFGKGVMQTTFVAPNGRALSLTVAEIFWPNGNSIHGVGLRAEGDHAVNIGRYASAEDFLRLI